MRRRDAEPRVRVAVVAPAELWSLLGNPQRGHALVSPTRAHQHEAVVLDEQFREDGLERKTHVDGERRSSTLLDDSERIERPLVAKLVSPVDAKQQVDRSIRDLDGRSGLVGLESLFAVVLVENALSRGPRES